MQVNGGEHSLVSEYQAALTRWLGDAGILAWVATELVVWVLICRELDRRKWYWIL